MWSTILLMVLVAITLFNIYAFVAGKRKKAASAVEVNRQQKELGEHALVLAKKERLDFNLHTMYMNDQGQGIFLAFDEKRKKLGIFMADDDRLFSYDDIVSVNREEKRDGGYVQDICLVLTTEEEKISYSFGKERRKASSMLGKFILNDAEECVTVIRNRLAEPEKSRE
jgi:hypothetical protein